MKFFYKLLFFFFVVSANVCGQDTAKTQIVQMLSNQSQAWNEGNIPKFMDDYWHSDDLQFVGKNGIVKGWQATLDRYLKTYPDKESMGKLEFSELQIDIINEDTAYVLGHWALERPEKGNIGGYFSLIIKKIDNSWKIVIDHTS